MSYTYRCWKCKEKHKSEERIIGLEPCPSCGVVAFAKPEDEGPLHYYQDEFLKSREYSRKINDYETLVDPKNNKEYLVPKGNNFFLEEMYKLLIPYSTKIVRKKTASVVLRDGDFDDHVMDTVGTLIRYYKLKPNFRISDSFGEYLSKISLQPIFNKKKQERDQAEQSFNALLSGDDGSELEEIIMKFALNIPETECLAYELYKREAIQEVMNILLLMLQAIKSNRGVEEYILFLTAFKLEMDEDVHPKKRASFWSTYRYDSDGDSREALFQQARFILIEGLKASIVGEDLDSKTKDMLSNLLQIRRNHGAYKF